MDTTWIAPTIIGLVLLAGLLTLAFGHKGWSWGTVVAAIFTLFAAGGYVYLALRVAERERAWTKLVRQYQADVLRERDAAALAEKGGPQPIPGAKSLVALAAEEARWRRALERVETWRGRSWKRASFTPPQGGEPGTIVLAEPRAAEPPPPAAEPAPAAEPGAEAAPGAEPAAGEPPAPGAEPAAGEAAPAEEPPPAEPAGEPAPAVAAATINPGAELSVFDDTPIEDGGRFVGVFRVVGVELDEATRRTTLQIVPVVPPDETDRKAWSKAYESVSVYEDLPVDRWMAFYRMPSQGDEEAAPGGLPAPAKTDPEKLLAKLERLEAEFERHGTVIEGDPAEIAAKLAGGDAPPGRYWAEVEFTAAHDLDEATVKRITELLAPDLDDESMVRRSFETGDRADLDLQTAVELGDKLKILAVIDRRPLADAATRILGGPIPGGAEGMRADGFAALRRMLDIDIADLERATAQLGRSFADVEAQRARFDEDRQAMQDDLREWAADVEAAERIRTGFEKRLKRASGNLAATVQAIGRLSRQLSTDVARLAAEVDRRAPAPARGGSLPAAGATR